MAVEMIQAVLDEAMTNERILVERFADRVEEHDVRLFVSRMIQVKALDLKEEVYDVAS